MMADRRSLASPLHSDGQGQKASWADGPRLVHGPSNPADDGQLASGRSKPAGDGRSAPGRKNPACDGQLAAGRKNSADDGRLAAGRNNSADDWGLRSGQSNPLDDSGLPSGPSIPADDGQLASGRSDPADDGRLASGGHVAGADGADGGETVGHRREGTTRSETGAGRVPHRVKLCLKARPTPAQLTDRLRAVDGVWPDGLELYLAAADLATPRMVEVIAQRVLNATVPKGFVWLIEGPVDSLDGGDFDITRESAADLLVLERLAQLANKIEAKAVNIHVISPSPDLGRLTLSWRETLLERAQPFLDRFVGLMHDAGTVPTVENMPPVLRMRRADYSFTPIGMASEDLRWLVNRVPGLKILADTSHAGLYLNARRADPDASQQWSSALANYVNQLPTEAPDLVGFMESLLPHVENAQISNAAGVLGEGLAYAEGDFDLDPAIRWLGQRAQHIVTEPIEANNEDARTMRDAIRRMRLALA